MPTATTTQQKTLTTTTTTTTTVTTVGAVHPLECNWLTRSLTSDEFERFLTQEAANHHQGILPLKHELLAEEEDLVDLESFLHTATAITSISPPSTPNCFYNNNMSLPSTTATSENSKKRGRPAKPAPASLKLSPTSPAPAAAKKESSPAPNREGSPDEMTEKYLKMRRCNNEASMKSRLRRKEKEAQNSEMVARLTSENALLKDQLASLRQEFAQLRSVLEKHL